MAAAVSPAMPAMPAMSPDVPELHRRTSLEEDYFYREVMTVARRPNEPPPSYESTMKKTRRRAKEAARAVSKGKSKGKGKEKEREVEADHLDLHLDADILPAYSCDVHIEGVFQRKMEIENTTKRAEDRRWASAYVVLHGTALYVHRCRKDRTWTGRSARGGPGVSPDRPPWLRKAALEKSYNLTYADVGIAADYVKRRYVIRVRAETDQFLLACVELETFVRWLDTFFAALSVAAPIDDRDFPRDQSIPRLQRIRWYTGRDPRASDSQAGSQVGSRSNSVSSAVSATTEASAATEASTATGTSEDTVVPSASTPTPPTPPTARAHPPQLPPSSAPAPHALPPPPPPMPSVSIMPTRLSTTNYPHDAVDTATGKWQPRHPWTRTHDMVYAKLCYATLLFRSPRKSNYIIMKGKQWFVDWATGDMFRVSPPRYGELEQFGPWQITRTENARI